MPKTCHVHPVYLSFLKSFGFDVDAAMNGLGMHPFFTYVFQVLFRNSLAKIECSGRMISHEITSHREVFLPGFLTKESQSKARGRGQPKALPL